MVIFLACSWEIVLAEGNSGPTFRREDNLDGGQKQNPRRSDDSLTSVRVYRNAWCRYKYSAGKFGVYVAKTCDLEQLFAGMDDDTFARAGGKRLNRPRPRQPDALKESITFRISALPERRHLFYRRRNRSQSQVIETLVSSNDPYDSSP